MSAIQAPPIRSAHAGVNDEESPSTADNWLLIHDAPRLRRDKLVLLRLDTLFSFFRSATPTLPLSNVDPIAAPPAEQNIPLRPQPAHVRNRHNVRRGQSRSLTGDGINDQITESSRRERSISPWQREVIDTRWISHSNRKSEIQKILSPLFAESTNNVLLLCWGDKERCNIIPINIRHEADEVNNWESIQTAWYTRRGHWRRYIPFYRVQQVNIVEVMVAGYESVRLGAAISDVQYLGLYQDVEIARKRTELENNIASYYPQVFPCPYNPSTGTVDCLSDCISAKADDVECPEKCLYESQRQLLHLTRRPLLTQAFSNGNVAKANNLLKGEKLVYSHSDLLKKIDEWHVPDLSEIPFHALLITEGWDFGTQSAIIPLTASFFFILVVVSKAIYNDWGIVWNVACFFVSLAGLILMWANHALRQ